MSDSFFQRAARPQQRGRYLTAGLLCVTLLTATINAQAAGSTVLLTSYNDADISFLYPKSWFAQTVSSQNGVVVISNDQTLLAAVNTSPTPHVTGDQILIEIVAGAAATTELNNFKTEGSLKASDNAVAVLKAIVKSASSTATTQYGTPEATNLINSTDAAQVSVKDSAAKDDGLVIALSPNDHPVFVAGVVAQGHLAADQLLIQGIASTIQPAGGASPAATSSATGSAVPLSETFTNKVYSLNYPKGWLTSSTTSDPFTVYLSTDQSLLDAANSGKFTLTTGQVLVGLLTGPEVGSLTGTSSSSSPSQLLTGLKTQMTNSTGIFSDMDAPTSVTIGTQSAAEAALTLKSGNGSGIAITFYQNKHPVILLGLTATGEAEANRALFEQIAASIVISITTP